MRYYMIGQENRDLLKQVTTWAGLAVISMFLLDFKLTYKKIEL